MSVAAAEPATVSRRGHRALQIAVVVSLALNLLTLGIIIASIWKWRQFVEMGPLGFPGQVLEFAKTLPPGKRSELQSLISNAEPELKPLKDHVRQTRREAFRAFLAEPFDREQFIAANGRLIQDELDIRQAQLGLMADVSSKLTAEERRAFLKWRRENRPNYWRRPGGGPAGGGASAATEAKQP